MRLMFSWDVFSNADCGRMRMESWKINDEKTKSEGMKYAELEKLKGEVRPSDEELNYRPDPEKRMLAKLKEALSEAECLEALKYLPDG
ncbi:Hypothetical predicted protein [Octopus vulgaris]|uniref:Uncharacterized protein n=1 Tax=Octopus vulgaris TaxID=6645 RepID=A0AA36BMR0_OCTVU|nr:Hypothetical predicted protein [Octopus vulgaris]